MGKINYEVSILGKDHLKSVSRKVVIGKSADLLGTESLGQYRKGASQIEEIKVQCTEKMKKLQQDGFVQQDLLNLKKDSSKLKDLEFVKVKNPPGPFMNVQEVEEYIKSTKETK